MAQVSHHEELRVGPAAFRNGKVFRPDCFGRQAMDLVVMGGKNRLLV